MTSVEHYKSNVADLIKDLDISLLFLNAGGSTPGAFADLLDSEIERQYRVNVMQPIYLTKALLPQMLTRKQRSGIVLTSSVIAHAPAPGLASYCSTKAAVRYWAEALHYEVADKIDVLSWDCGSVDTNLNTFNVGFRVSPKTAVEGCLQNVGKTRRSFGCWQSELEGIFTPWTPMWVNKMLIMNEANR